MEKIKEDRIKEQLILNNDFLINNPGLNNTNIDESVRIAIKDLELTLLQTDEPVKDEESKIQVLRMIYNALHYIDTGNTRWANTDIYVDCVHCDKKILKTSAVWDSENEIWYCPKCASELGI